MNKRSKLEIQLAQERQIARAAGGAFRAAYRAALEAGLSVVIAKNGNLVQVHPDGSRVILKKIPKPVKVVHGRAVSIQWRSKFPG